MTKNEKVWVFGYIAYMILAVSFIIVMKKMDLFA